MIYGLILAGGKGSRLYPLSRANEPKQFLKIINGKSFLENTVDRVTPLINKDNLYVVTNKDYHQKVIEELKDIRKENIFSEPSNKETALCTTEVLLDIKNIEWMNSVGIVSYILTDYFFYKKYN